MANAYKCDVCGIYYDGSSFIVTVIPKDLKSKTVQLDICDNCIATMFEALNKEGLETRGIFE